MKNIIENTMRYSWMVVGMLFFPAMDSRCGFATTAAVVALNVAIVSTIAYCITLIKK